MTVTIVYIKSKKDCWGILKKEFKIEIKCSQ